MEFSDEEINVDTDQQTDQEPTKNEYSFIFDLSEHDNKDIAGKKKRDRCVVCRERKLSHLRPAAPGCTVCKPHMIELNQKKANKGEKARSSFLDVMAENERIQQNIYDRKMEDAQKAQDIIDKAKKRTHNVDAELDKKMQGLKDLNKQSPIKKARPSPSPTNATPGKKKTTGPSPIPKPATKTSMPPPTTAQSTTTSSTSSKAHSEPFPKKASSFKIPIRISHSADDDFEEESPLLNRKSKPNGKEEESPISSPKNWTESPINPLAPLGLQKNHFVNFSKDATASEFSNEFDNVISGLENLAASSPKNNKDIFEPYVNVEDSETDESVNYTDEPAPNNNNGN